MKLCSPPCNYSISDRLSALPTCYQQTRLKRPWMGYGCNIMCCNNIQLARSFYCLFVDVRNISLFHAFIKWLCDFSCGALSHFVPPSVPRCFHSLGFDIVMHRHSTADNCLSLPSVSWADWGCKTALAKTQGCFQKVFFLKVDGGRGWQKKSWVPSTAKATIRFQQNIFQVCKSWHLCFTLSYCFYLSDFIICKFIFSGICIPQLWWVGILESALYPLVKLSIYGLNFLSYFLFYFIFYQNLWF